MEDNDDGYVVMIDDSGAHELEPSGGRWFKGRKVDMVVRKAKSSRSTGRVAYWSNKELFYVGSKDIAHNFAPGAALTSHPLTTEEQAVDRARKACAETGQPQIVVKIVAFVESAARPVTVRRLD